MQDTSCIIAQLLPLELLNIIKQLRINHKGKKHNWQEA